VRQARTLYGRYRITEVKLRHVTRFAITALIATVLSGCGTAIKVRSGQMPDAIVQQLPLRVGVRFDESITDFSYQEKLATGGTYSIDLDDASAEMLTSTFGDLFQEMILVPPGEEVPPVDILIEPTLSALEFVVPSQTISNDYAIWIKYQIKVYDSTGKIQADFLIPAYGKAPKDSLVGGTKGALTQAAMRALRDASTVLLTRFVADAKLEGRQLRPVQVAERPAPAQTEPSNEDPDTTADEVVESELSEQYL